MSTARDRFFVVIATCGGLGYSPILPGTAGALIGVALFLPIAMFVASPILQSALIALALAVSCWVTVALAKWAEEYFDEKDSGIFVTDEVAGFLFTMLLFWWPWLYHFEPSTAVWLAVAWGFPITRTIDIIKVPPAKQLEKLPAGWGVLADDLLGSVYAAIVLHVIAFWKPAWFGIVPAG